MVTVNLKGKKIFIKKKLLVLLPMLLLGFVLRSQTPKTNYPFHIDIQGEGSPIILIPGLASSGKVWDQAVATLAKNYQCHILTLAGFSTQPPIKTDSSFLPVIQEKIIQYVEQELQEKPILIGHSLGGFLSLSIASAQPDLVHKIVIVDSYPFYSAAMNPSATEASAKSQADMMKTMLVNMTDDNFAIQQKQMMAAMVTDSAHIEVVTEWSIQSDRHTMAQAMYELMTTDLREEVELVKCPILVFGSWYAAKDYGVTAEMVEKNYKTQFTKAKDCTIKIANTGKHFIMLDEPQWFIENLESFL
ncbi:MAG: alpha/beta hydrolase [Bacteroidota bacterium]